MQYLLIISIFVIKTLYYSPCHHAPSLRFVDDEELAYVLTRMREVHDFWHVLFECDTSVMSELAVKALEFVQVGNRESQESGYYGIVCWSF